VEVGRQVAGRRDDGVDEGLAPSVAPLGDVPDRRRGICEDGLEKGSLSIAEGVPQGATKLETGITYGANQSSDGLAAFLIPPRVFPVRVWATFVKQQIRCEAERGVQLICGVMDVGDGEDGRDRDVADERSPVIVFRVIYNPSLTGRGVGVGTGKREGVEEASMVGPKAQSEGDFA
jgi:hypothetical protein